MQSKSANNFTRSAFHADSWYSGDCKSIKYSQIPRILIDFFCLDFLCLFFVKLWIYKENELNQELNLYFEAAQKDKELESKKIKGIIGPHAGIEYCGPTAAWGYQYLNPTENLRVFLLGPSHKIDMKKCATSALKVFETPLGNISLDLETLEELNKTGKFVQLKKFDEENEHSLELHLPYIQKMLGSRSFKLVPIMVGNLTYEQEQEYGELFSSYLDDDNTVFLISADFCHWGARFGYQPYKKEDGEIWQSITKLDKIGMDLIEQHDVKKFDEYLKSTQNNICGKHPVAIFLQAVINSKKYPAGTLKTKFLHYSQSDQVLAQRESSVSYAASVTYA